MVTECGGISSSFFFNNNFLLGNNLVDILGGGQKPKICMCYWPGANRVPFVPAFHFVFVASLSNFLAVVKFSRICVKIYEVTSRPPGGLQIANTSRLPLMSLKRLSKLDTLKIV